MKNNGKKIERLVHYGFFVLSLLGLSGGFSASNGVAEDPAPQQCLLELSTAKPVLPVDRKETICLKVGVTGFKVESETKAPDLNIALVIDCSGSMSGDKIRQAREAALCAVNQMKETDIVSLIAYSSDVTVLVPATKVGDKKEIIAQIEKLEAEGTTALYAGTEKGGEEVKKFFDKGKVNRVILLSDGLANVGPSSPEDLQKLGQKLGGEGITVTTFGLGEGFNEDLMLKLAQASDGNHVFITSSKNLVEVFDEEFRTATKAVAGEVSCKVTCAEGVRPIRVLNREAEISGQDIQFSWNQIYSGHQRYVMMELEVPAGENGQTRKIADANLTYANLKTNATDKLSASLEVKYSDSESEITNAINKKVMEDYVLQTATLANEEAVRLRDAGDIKGAKSKLSQNASFLRDNAKGFGGSTVLMEAADMAESYEETISNEAAWNSNRKAMKSQGAASMNQQLAAPVK